MAPQAPLTLLCTQSRHAPERVCFEQTEELLNRPFTCGRHLKYPTCLLPLKAMKNLLVPFDFYLLRMPARPISDLARLHAHQSLEALAGALHALYQSADIQEAIYLASPELYQEVRKWLAKPCAADWAQDERLLLTLYKYMLRMSTRSTPYGLFAGFSTGSIGATATRLILENPASRSRKHARLDMNYVAELSKQVVADPTLQAQLKLFVNTSLYRKKDTYRYYEYRVRNKRRQYYLVAFKASEYIDKMLTAARNGATHAQLLELLTTSGIASGPARGFLIRLLDAQVLVSELEPTVTGSEFYRSLLDKVRALHPNHPQMAPLREIGALLEAATDVSTYQKVQGIIQESFPAASSKDLIQTDLCLNMQANALSANCVNTLSQELSELSGLYRTAVPTDLQSFVKNFLERYEGQEIPLLEALDNEGGIGYGPVSGNRANHTPFIDLVGLPKKPTPPTVTWTNYRQLVFRKFHESQLQDLQSVVLTEQDLAGLAAKSPAPLPATLFAMGSFIAADATALDNGNFQFNLVNCAGPGAMLLLSRFAHADPALADKLRACGQQEQLAAGEALLAEVVHLPEARVGNVLQRPQLRTYEIPFLGTASVPLEQQIQVDDLLVSVQQGTVVLRSKRLNRVVLPRLTSAHNYRNGLPLYRFLCDLQQQQQPLNILWDWGQLASQPFLPRVEYKRIIVRRAQWQLPATTHAELAALHTPAQLTDFLARYRLPRQVVLADGDNELLLDFDCPLAATVLCQRLKKGPATLFEFVHDANSQLVTDEQNNTFLHEVIIPFAHVEPTTAPVALRSVRSVQPVQRSFAPGSEWTYLKVYCGGKWGDKLLTDYLLPCLLELEELQLLKKWFFIRYSDPHSHLRLRLHHDANPAHIAAIIGCLHRALGGLQQERVVQAVQYDTYHRELERYGVATMVFSETIFYHDSRTVLHFLNLLEGEEGERYRWLFALRGVDEMLSAFGLSLTEKLALAEQSHRDFFAEFHGDSGLTRRLNDKYRIVSRDLAAFMDATQNDPDTAEAVALFAARAAAIRAAYADLQTAFAIDYPDLEVQGVVRPLLPSYLHMFLNRIFLANQRVHELVLYHYLSKHYKSLAARQKHLVITPR
jgi:lantibiotic biosynthesis protein